jgi:hypothetical protein
VAVLLVEAPDVFTALNKAQKKKWGSTMPLDIRARIENDFTYHAPTPEQVQRYNQLREAAKAFALLIVDLTPISREQSLALTELEYSVMMANASIARNEVNVWICLWVVFSI